MFGKMMMAGLIGTVGMLALEIGAPAVFGTSAEAAQQKRAFSRAAPVRATPRPTARFVAPRNNVVRTNRVITNTHINNTNRGNFHRNTTVIKQQNFVAPVGLPKTGSGPSGSQVLMHGALKAGPGGLGKLPAGPGLKPGLSPVVLLNNKPFPIMKGPKKIWWGGGWKSFVPFAALGGVLLGGAYYYPDAYISVARPYCSGLTPNGCRLNWQMVGFEGGGGEYQCVEFCPRPGAPPPAQVVALAAPPAPQTGRCEVTIFSEPGFAGSNAPSGEDQPRLVDSGWKNQIASVQVQAGTWDFYSDDEFHGETMRLAPGPYPQLGPDWTKRIGSFMCVQGN